MKTDLDSNNCLYEEESGVDIRNELISVIVPVYNVSKYLEECVFSIIEQSYKYLEIILIDDGSTDDSGKICDSIRQIDKRIIVIHKKNGGLSSARNAGIRAANGLYITCIDSDDVVSREYVEKLYKILLQYKADMSICKLKMLIDGEKASFTQIENGQTSVLEPEEAHKEMLRQLNFDVSACGKLYKKDMFHDICYPEGKIYEDLATTYKLIEKANKVVFIDEELYLYRKRIDSITTSQYSIRNLEIFSAFQGFEELIEQKYPKLVVFRDYRKAEMAATILTKIDTKGEKNKQTIHLMKKIIISKLFSISKNKEIQLKKKVKIYLALINNRMLKKAFLYNQKNFLNKRF